LLVGAVTASGSFFGRVNSLSVNGYIFFVNLLLSFGLRVGRFNFCEAGDIFLFFFSGWKSKLFCKLWGLRVGIERFANVLALGLGS